MEQKRLLTISAKTDLADLKHAESVMTAIGQSFRSVQVTVTGDGPGVVSAVARLGEMARVVSAQVTLKVQDSVAVQVGSGKTAQSAS